MAFLKMHSGVHYHEFIRQVLAKKAARSYLEIGVRDGGLLSQIEVPSIGVDPNFVLAQNVVGRKRKLILLQLTSDDFSGIMMPASSSEDLSTSCSSTGFTSSSIF